MRVIVTVRRSKPWRKAEQKFLRQDTKVRRKYRPNYSTTQPTALTKSIELPVGGRLPFTGAW